MIEPADLVAALRQALRGADAPIPAEMLALLDSLAARAGEPDPARFRAALAEALPELRALQAQVGAAASNSAQTAQPGPPDPERALALGRELAQAWAQHDGEAVDKLLGELGEAPAQLGEDDRARIHAEVRGAIAAKMADIQLKPLGGG